MDRRVEWARCLCTAQHLERTQIIPSDSVFALPSGARAVTQSRFQRLSLLQERDMSFPIWDLDESKILTRRELATVLSVVPRSANQRRNRIIFRLACCCGLRVSEIAALRMDDVIVGVPRPHLRLRRETTKGKRD